MMHAKTKRANGALIRISGLRADFGALLLAGLVAFAPGSASAATNNMVFQGNINSNSSCAVVVNQHGDLGISANIRQLSSKIAGGRPGKVTIQQRGIYTISATSLPFFSAAPSGGDTGVTRQVRMSGSAVNLVSGFTVAIPEMAASPGIQVNSFGANSRVNLDIHFIADRTVSYPTGFYQQIVTVRCE